MRNAPEFIALAPVIAQGDSERTLSPREEKIAAVIQPALADLSVRMEDIMLKGEGPGRSLQILVDDAEITTVSLDLDRVADASRAISEALDESDIMGQEPYDLEVSTPGLSRPLTHLHHFQRNVGRLLRLKLRGESPVEGRLLEITDEGIVIQGEKPAKKGVKPKLADPQTVRFTDIIKAKVEVEFTTLDDEPLVEEA